MRQKHRKLYPACIDKNSLGVIVWGILSKGVSQPKLVSKIRICQAYQDNLVNGIKLQYECFMFKECRFQQKNTL